MEKASWAVASPCRDPIRFGLIGLGRWGRLLASHLAVEGQLTWCCSTPRGTGARWAREHLPHGTWTADADELIASDTVDAVVIATPISTHTELARRALSGGKHMFVEKPLTTSVTDAERLLGAVATSSAVAMVDYTFLFDAGVRALLRILAGDPPVRVRLTWHKWGTFAEPMLWNLLSHDAAFVTALVDEAPRSIVVSGDPADVRCDRVSVRLRFPGDLAVEVITNRRVRARRKEIRVLARSGREYSWRDGELMSSGEPIPALCRNADSSPLKDSVRHFAEAIKTARRPEPDLAFSLRVTQLLCAISAASGHLVPSFGHVEG